MKDSAATFKTVEGDNSRKEPVRLLVVQGEARPAVDATDEPMVMTVPHLLLRELITLVGASLFLVLLSLLFDAPLEELASAEKTPNPAKAPWYFLGLQELLHYYPPVIAGVIIPTAVILALIIIPYFDLNLHRQPLWAENRRKRVVGWWIANLVVSLGFLVSGKHPVWALAGCVWFVGLLGTVGAYPTAWGALGRWASKKSLSFWVFFWF
ncbi:hypothetical protein IT157_04960, partial [bacterium]|nr:hypothetical protein [bacterium]